MSGKWHHNGAVFLFALSVVVLCLSVAPPSMGALEDDPYGEIVSTSATNETGLVEGSEKILESDETLESDEAFDGPEEDATETTSESIPGEPDVGLDEAVAADTEDDGGEVGEGEEVTASAIVYVFNNDDDKLSVSLFIDSELKGTEDISKEKEVKFGSYPLMVGTHKFKISWWDDDTKEGYEEETVENIYEEKAITLYTTENTEPEEFDVTVEVVNQNDKDLDAYLYIDGAFEKSKEVKAEKSTDFGKIDVEEGVHEFSIRWRDPDTKVEYEKRKTTRVDGDEVVVFYAPKGIVFESEDVEDEPAAKSSAVGRTATKTISASTGKGNIETSSRSNAAKLDSTTTSTGKDEPKDESKDEDEATASPARNAEETDQEPRDAGKPSPSGEIGEGLYLLIIGMIVAIYLIFFRH